CARHMELEGLDFW
nr:immunoglobulin heavy chain junction region [Macaca mulatta]